MEIGDLIIVESDYQKKVPYLLNDIDDRYYYFYFYDKSGDTHLITDMKFDQEQMSGFIDYNLVVNLFNSEPLLFDKQIKKEFFVFVDGIHYPKIYQDNTINNQENYDIGVEVVRVMSQWESYLIDKKINSIITD